MSLRVTCACGKSFDAQSKLAGKTVKCPACGGPLTVPNPAAAPAQSTAPGSIRVSCTCGKSLNAKPELAGRKVKCPACGSSLVVPTPLTPQPANVNENVLMPLEELDPFANDPLGLGDFDENALGPAPAAKLAPRPAATKQAAAKPATMDDTTKKIVWTIGGVVAVLAVVIIFFVVVILPELGKLGDSSGNGDVARNNSSVTRPIPPLNPTDDPANPRGFPQLGAGATAAQQTPPITEWITFTSQPYGCSVLLPSTPKEQNDTDPSGSTRYMAISDLRTSVYFLIVHSPPANIAALPNFSITETMDHLINAQIEVDQGEELSRKTMFVDGRRCREVIYNAKREGQTFRASARYIAVDRKIYVLMHLSVGDPGPELQNFFESFKLTS